MPQPLVTISIPLYNCEEFLVKCLDSVRNQTYSAIEVSLINDQTPDNSVAIAEEYIQKYNLKNWRILHLDKNSGLSVVRNKGIDTANGKYIFFLDSDDTISADCMETVVKIAEETEAELVVGSTEQVKLPENEKRLIFPINHKTDWIEGNDEILISFVNRGFPECSWNKLIRLNFLKENQIYFVPDLYAQDSLHTFQMALHLKKIAFSRKITYEYYLHSASVIHNRGKRHFDNWFTIAKYFDIELKKESNKKRKEWIKKHLINYKSMTLIMNWRAQKNEELWKESYRNYKTLSSLSFRDYFSNSFSNDLKKKNLFNNLPISFGFQFFRWRYNRK